MYKLWLSFPKNIKTQIEFANCIFKKARNNQLEWFLTIFKLKCSTTVPVKRNTPVTLSLVTLLPGLEAKHILLPQFLKSASKHTTETQQFQQH